MSELKQLANTQDELLKEISNAPTVEIMDMMSKVFAEIKYHEKPIVFVSGGSDSDILLDVMYRFDPHKKATYAFNHTGVEYEATKRHLEELEERYGIKIERTDPVMPIPTCCRKYGVPFWSKQVSEFISRLQRHGFKWEDRPYEELIVEYPRCSSALKWWCNTKPKKKNGKESSFNIAYIPWLKEFMIANPPPPISSKCCEKAKKAPARKYESKSNFDLICTGLRKSEGGARARAHNTCIDRCNDGADRFRPLFWLTNKDKKFYKNHYGIVNSDCYEVWGMDRTGCCGCPLGKNFEQELELMKQYEPKMYKAANKIFGASYEYTRAYLKFRKEMQKRTEGETGVN